MNKMKNKNKILTLTILMVAIIRIAAFTQNQYDLVPYLDGRLYGFADLKGNVVIQPDYEKVKLFDSLGFADVDHYGLKAKINRNGEWAIPPMANHYTMTRVRNFDGNHTKDVPGLYWVSCYNKEGMTLFNTNSKVVNNSIFHYHQRGLQYLYKSVSNDFTNEIFEYGLKKIVFKDSTTNLLRLNGTYFYKDNQYNVDVISDRLIVKAYNPVQFGLYDYKDNLTLPDTFIKMSVIANGKYFIASTKLTSSKNVENIFILNRDGKKVFQKSFTKVKYLFDDLFYVFDSEGNKIINEKGDIITTRYGIEIQPVCDKYFATNSKDTLVLLDKSLQPILYMKGGQLSYSSNKDYFHIRENNRTYLYNKDAKRIFECDSHDLYVQLGLENSNVIILSEDRKDTKTIIDNNGKILFTFSGNITPLNHHNAYLCSHIGKSGIYNLEKGWIFPFTFNRIEHDNATNDLFITKNNISYQIDKKFNIKKIKENVYQGVRTLTTIDSIFFIYPDDVVLSCLNSKEIRAIKDEKITDAKLFITKSTKKFILDSTFTNIIPNGYFLSKLNEFVNLSNGKTGICVTNDTLIGLIDCKGNWLISPLEGKQIVNLDFDYIKIEKHKTYVLYDKNFKPIIVKPNQFVRVIDSDRLALVEFEKFKPQTYLVCDEYLNPLSNIQFESCNFEKNIFINSKFENEQKWICFYTNNYSLDTCLSFEAASFTQDKDGRIIVRNNKGYGIVTKDYDLVVPNKYTKIEYKEPFFFLHESDDNTYILSKDNKIIDLQFKVESITFDEDGENYLLQNIRNEQSIMLDKKGNVLSRFNIYCDLIRKDDYNYFKDMMRCQDKNNKFYYVNKYTGVVYKK